MRWFIIILLCLPTFSLDAFFDVVIVSHYKDYETLPLCIESIKKYIPDHARIFVIGNREIYDKDFIFVHESNFYRYINPEDMKNQWKQHNSRLAPRAFWIFQQFLKLGAPLIIEDLSENYLCVDSDIAWIRPQKFISDTGHFFYSKHKACCCCPKGLHAEYIRISHKLLGEKCAKIAPFSFIAHHMIFNKTMVKKMLDCIEGNFNKPWYKAIFSSLNFNQVSNFSEYELYGNWLWNNYPDHIDHKQVEWAGANPLDNSPVSQEYDFISSQYYDRHSHNMGYPV